MFCHSPRWSATIDAVTARLSDRLLVVLAGGVCLLLATVLSLADPGQRLDRMREAIFDQLIAWPPQDRGSGRVAVVEIDRESLAEFGDWPWSRDRLALLIEKIAGARPEVIAINILLSEKTAADQGASDTRLAEAIARAPTVLALVLDPEAGTALAPATPIAVTGPVAVPDLLAAPGVVPPSPVLMAAARGVGVISLPAADGQPVRKVVLLAAGAKAILAGFAVETLRVAAGDLTLIATASPQVLRIGEHVLPLEGDGQMRLRFATPSRRDARTMSALDVLEGRIDPSRLTGKIVLVGASAPESGGLRLTAADPFLPSVQIEADATEQMLSGDIPQRRWWMPWLEAFVAICAGTIGIAAAGWWPAGRAAVAIAAILSSCIAVAIFVSVAMLRLVDPMTPAAIAFSGVLGAGLTQFRLSSRRRAAIERRFALHLSPELVRRISDHPDELKVAGETRTITALFTDIEGFTALTEHIGPERMVSLLDHYVDTVANLIVGHGGMVDKIVGDGLIAFFNAPVDLPDHAQRAVACAIEIVAATEALRREPQWAEIGLGRTRVGIETGPAVLGDVGRGIRRNYTALGRAVNVAARLEAANKSFGSSIALGPGTAAALEGKYKLRHLGRIELRGIAEAVDVFEPDSEPPIDRG